MLMQVRIKIEGDRVSTDGLAVLGYAELVINKIDPRYMVEAENLLNYVAKYQQQTNQSIENSVINYGSWAIKLLKDNEGLLEVWELDADGKEFTKGANFTLEIWHVQNKVCENYNSEFDPPHFDALVGYSDGFPNEYPLDCTRYPYSDRMSGWCFLTNKYNGDLHSLTFEHIAHLRKRYVAIFPYLALKKGFNFIVNDDKIEKVWFDEEVAERSV